MLDIDVPREKKRHKQASRMVLMSDKVYFKPKLIRKDFFKGHYILVKKKIIGKI